MRLVPLILIGAIGIVYLAFAIWCYVDTCRKIKQIEKASKKK